MKDILLSPFEEGQEVGKLAIQQKAFEQIENLEVPTSKNEEWKYFQLKPFLNKDYSFNLSQEISDEVVENLEFSKLKANHLVFVNGAFSAKHSQILENTSKIQILSFKDVLENKKDLLEKYLKQIPKNTEDIFGALNTAFAQDGAFICIEKGQELAYPIVLNFIVDASKGNTLSQNKNVILAGENSRFSVVENYLTLGQNDSFQNLSTQFFVESYAHLEHYKIQKDTEKAHQIGTTEIVLEDNAYFANHTISLSGGRIRNNLNILVGEHCEAYLNGLSLLKGKTVVDNHTIADHLKPHSMSDELYKTILDERSMSVFNGKVYVRPDAQKTNAFQSNANILLSQNARVDTKPQLEIWADDVKCSHGATTGVLDQEALFYLRARGISKPKAISLLLGAFAMEVLDRIENKNLKEHLQSLVENRL